MRILSILNVSSLETIESDSGFIMQRTLARALYMEGHHFGLVIPKELFGALSAELSCETNFASLGRTKYEVRLAAPWNDLRTAIEQFRPDTILCNQIELTTAVRGIATTIGNPGISIVSYCHYIPGWLGSNGGICNDPSQDDGHLCRPLLHHVIAGALASDLIYVQSEFAREQLIGISLQLGEDLSSKVRCLPPPFDPTMVLESNRTNRRSSNGCIYNHRLYEHYGTSAAIELFDALNSSIGCSIRVADPLYKRSAARSSIDGSPGGYRNQLKTRSFVELLDGGDDRLQYRSWIDASAVGIAALRPNAVWSMSLVDVMGMGIPVVAPRIGAYPEMVPDQLLFSDTESACDIVARLLGNEELWLEASALCHGKIQPLSPASIARTFAADVTALIRKRNEAYCNISKNEN
jgi:hypothetical protein